VSRAASPSGRAPQDAGADAGADVAAAGEPLPPAPSVAPSGPTAPAGAAGIRGHLLRAWPLATLGLAGALAWALATGRPPAEAAPDGAVAPAVPVAEARLADLPVTIRTHGTITPWTELALVAEIDGRVASVSPRLEAGRRFEAGELLVAIDPGDAEDRLERARALVARARAEARLAEARLERLEHLAAREVASRAALEEALHRAETARAELRRAAAEREQAARDLERTRLRAPFTGRVRTRRVETGQLVSRGSVLAEIYAIDRARVRLPVPAGELAYLALPESARAEASLPEGPGVGGLAEGHPSEAGPDEGPRAAQDTSDASPPEAGADDARGPVVHLRAELAGRTLRWEGRVLRSEGVVDRRTRMVYLVARIDDPEEQLPAGVQQPVMGQFVAATITGRTLRDVVVLPAAALQREDEVLVLDEDQRLRRRAVEVLPSQEDRIVVDGGLEPGARVALPGPASLEALEGVRVRPIEAGPDAGHAELAGGFQ